MRASITLALPVHRQNVVNLPVTTGSQELELLFIEHIPDDDKSVPVKETYCALNLEGLQQFQAPDTVMSLKVGAQFNHFGVTGRYTNPAEVIQRLGLDTFVFLELRFGHLFPP